KVPLEAQTFPCATGCLFGSRFRGKGFPVQCVLHRSHPPLPALGPHSRRGEPSYFTPLRPAEVPRFPSGSGLKLTQLAIRSVRGSGQRKKSRLSCSRSQVPAQNANALPLAGASHSA